MIPLPLLVLLVCAALVAAIACALALVAGAPGPPRCSAAALQGAACWASCRACWRIAVTTTSR